MPAPAVCTPLARLMMEIKRELDHEQIECSSSIVVYDKINNNNNKKIVFSFPTFSSSEARLPSFGVSERKIQLKIRLIL
jgi:hypothetical protein